MGELEKYAGGIIYVFSKTKGPSIKYPNGKRGRNPQLQLYKSRDNSEINPAVFGLFNGNNGASDHHGLFDSGVITPLGNDVLRYITESKHLDMKYYVEQLMNHPEYQSVPKVTEPITPNADTKTNQSHFELNAYNVLKKMSDIKIMDGKDVYSLEWLAIEMTGERKVSQNIMNDVNKIIKSLDDNGCITISEISKHGRTKTIYKLNQNGKNYFKQKFKKQQSLTQQIIYEPPVNSSILHGDILAEFSELESYESSVDKTKDNKSDTVLRNIQIDEIGNESPLLYTEKGALEGFDGAVYVKIDETAYRIGLVTGKKELIPSPELVYAQIASVENKNNWGKKRFNQELIDIFTKKLNIDESESKSLAFGLDETYKDTITTANRNLTDSGKLFLNASEQLFQNYDPEFILHDFKLYSVILTPQIDVYSDIQSLVNNTFSAQEKKEKRNRQEKDNGQKDRNFFKNRNRAVKKKQQF